MSSAATLTVANLQRMTAPQLREILLTQARTGKKQVTVVDVRDSDHIGGHIRTSTWHPSHTHDHSLPSLARTEACTPIIVFHCALSQVRGPKAALQYLRVRERLGLQGSSSSSVGEKMKRSAVEGEKEGEGEKRGGGEWEDVDGEDGEVEQKVYVLQDGFQGWQEKYGEDEMLTEGFRPEIWREED